jgi:hypothetical protein
MALSLGFILLVVTSSSQVDTARLYSASAPAAASTSLLLQDSIHDDNVDSTGDKSQRQSMVYRSILGTCLSDVRNWWRCTASGGDDILDEWSSSLPKDNSKAYHHNNNVDVTTASPAAASGTATLRNSRRQNMAAVSLLVVEVCEACGQFWTSIVGLSYCCRCNDKVFAFCLDAVKGGGEEMMYR